MELKEAIAQEKIIIGKERTLKLLRTGSLTHVFLSSNCPQKLKADIAHYSKLFNIPVSELKEGNEELGILCKKPFSISMLSVLK